MNDAEGRNKTKKRFGILSLLILFAVLVATIWPFNPFPHNDVTWIAGRSGVHFGAHGIVASLKAFQDVGPQEDSSASLEVWLRPESVSKVNTLLSFSSVGNARQFRLRQYIDGLLIQRDSATPEKGLVTAEIDVDHIFHPEQELFLTIVSGRSGTKIYQNGKLVQTSGGYRILANDFEGDLVIGTSSFFQDSWEGDLRGLAFYSKELNEEEVRSHFQMWTKSGKLEHAEADQAISQYFFDEREGSEIGNQVHSQPDLHIRQHFQIPHKAMLRPPGIEFKADWDYVKDLVRNVAGFMPLGAVFFLYFSIEHSRRRALIFAVLLSGFCSLGIEILQRYIPQRVSGMTDIITNTLGAGIGAMLASSERAAKALSKLKIGNARQE